MAKLVFPTDLQQYTDGVAETEVTATSYRALVSEVKERFPLLTDAILDQLAVAIDGTVVDQPLLETFSEDSELVLLARVRGG